MKVILVGGGKIGYYLAKILMERGYELTLIEQEPAAAKKLADELDLPVICGDATALGTLESAKPQLADAVIAVTGTDENNLVCCQLCKKMFHLPKVVAKVNDPKNVEIFRRLGVDIVVSSTDSIVRLLEREVDNSRIRELLEVGEDASIQEILLPKPYKLEGTLLSELRLPQNSIIISVTREKKLIIPRGNTRLQGGDTLLVMAKDSAVGELQRRLKLSEE
jgi:trk system potassium uptake protein TrkA